ARAGLAFSGTPRATAAAILTGTDLPVLERAAKRLAAAYWDARDRFVFGTAVGSIEDCVAEALASSTRPAVLADSGDNPTGGGVGDRADVLAELVRQGATETIVAAITDLPALEAAFAEG
ncbi:MlrC C-terminal domain-containing protein, partial [Mycobacterium tuberculosis]|nr:MlrC C-terminal domain-containing protein [Mycobacterium tuberculosis]